MLNNAGGLRTKLLVILNDNKMSICPRTGALAGALDKWRVTHFYNDSKRTVSNILSHIPWIGKRAKGKLEGLRAGLKAMMTGGMLFEDLGFRYFGPVDGHDLPALRKWISDLKEQDGPILCTFSRRRGMVFRRPARTR